MCDLREKNRSGNNRMERKLTEHCKEIHYIFFYYTRNACRCKPVSGAEFKKPVVHSFEKNEWQKRGVANSFLLLLYFFSSNFSYCCYIITIFYNFFLKMVRGKWKFLEFITMKVLWDVNRLQIDNMEVMLGRNGEK